MRSYGILLSVYWQFLTDVSGQHTGPICRGKKSICGKFEHWRWRKKSSLDFLTLEDVADGLSRKAGKELPTATHCVIAQKGAYLVSIAAED